MGVFVNYDCAMANWIILFCDCFKNDSIAITDTNPTKIMVYK